MVHILLGDVWTRSRQNSLLIRSSGVSGITSIKGRAIDANNRDEAETANSAIERAERSSGPTFHTLTFAPRELLNRGVCSSLVT
jgi:hypothetical protein